MTFTSEQAAHETSGPKFRPELALLALGADGEPGGICINNVRDNYNAQNGTHEGMIGVVGVRRPFRRRGLAHALLAQSMALLKVQGMDTAVLDVDAATPSGATRLYESVGFTERKRITVYEKSLPTAAPARGF